METTTDEFPDNFVALRGKVSGEPETVTLPSGDQVVSFRLVVQRSVKARRRSKQKVDTFDCSAWTAALRRSAGTLKRGDQVRVSGELRRRFSRSAAGPISFVTIDLDTCSKVRR